MIVAGAETGAADAQEKHHVGGPFARVGKMIASNQEPKPHQSDYQEAGVGNHIEGIGDAGQSPGIGEMMVRLRLAQGRQQKRRDNSPQGQRAKQPHTRTAPSSVRQPPQGTSQLKCLSRVKQEAINKPIAAEKKEGIKK